MRMPGPHNCYDWHQLAETDEVGRYKDCPGGRPPTVPEMIAWMREHNGIDYEAAGRRVVMSPLTITLDLDTDIAEALALMAVDAALGVTE